MRKTTNHISIKEITLMACFAIICSCLSLHAAWQSTNGPYGGTIKCITSSGNTIYIGTSDGIYTSVNSGNTWTKTSNGIEGMSINAIVVQGTTIFAATTNAGVYISSNNASSWQAANNGISNAYVSSLLLDGSLLYASTLNAGLYVSSDNGSSWSTKNTGLTDLDLTSIAKSGSTLFVGTDSSGVFISSNNGDNWAKSSSGLGDTVINTLATIGTKVFAGTSSALYSTSNNGTSWLIAGINQSVLSIASYGTNIYVGGLLGSAYFSSNNGLSWSVSNNSLSGKNILAIYANANNAFIGTEGDGLYISSSSPSVWAQSNAGILNTNVSVLLPHTASVYAGTLQSGIFKTSNSGSTWQQINTGITSSNITCMAVQGSTLFAGTELGVFSSSDNGSTWSIANTGLPSDKFITSIMAKGSNIYVGTRSDAIYTSANAGQNWSFTSNGFVHPNVKTSSMAFINDTIFAGLGGLYGAGSEAGVYRSVNNGSTWQAVNSGLINRNVYSVLTVGSKVYAGTAAGVYVSDNHGSSWLAMDNGLPDNTIIYSMVANNGTIFIGTNSGVYFNFGNQWISVNAGLPANSKVYALCIYAGDLFVSIENNAVWKRALSEITCSGNECLVWPGDVNNDMIVNNFDLLPIGVHYGETGIAREEVSNDWSAQLSANWSFNQYSNVNLKYADCNGDGTINRLDTLAIHSNFSSTHNKKERERKTTVGEPELYFTSNANSYNPSNDITLDVWIGSSSLPVQNVYAIAFNIDYSSVSLIEEVSSVSFTSNQFLGTDILSIAKNNEIEGKIYNAITRINNTNVDGYGKIASIKLKVNATVNESSSLTFSVSDYLCIDSIGNSIDLSLIDKTVAINPLGIKEASTVAASIYPNPTDGVLSLKFNNAFSGKILLKNMLGEVVYNSYLDRSLTTMLDLQFMPKGLYFLTLQSENKQEVTKKIILN